MSGNCRTVFFDGGNLIKLNNGLVALRDFYAMLVHGIHDIHDTWYLRTNLLI